MNRRPTEPSEPTERSQRLVQQRQQRQLQPMVLTNGGSPALTIDNDSFSSIRPHVMGHPGARVHPPLQYHTTNALPPPQQLSSRGDRQEISLRRRNESSPLGITRHNALHKQLLLVDTPDPHHSQSLVGRLSVVRPSNADIIVVEAKRSGSGPESPSVEAIYQVIGSNSMARAMPPQPQPPKTAVSVDGRPIAIPKSRLGKLRPAQRNLPTSRQVVEAGPVYTRDGSFRARRPESIILMASSEEEPIAAVPPAIEVTDSYCNDIGYDLANAEIDSLYCRSFDIDLLPDAPERKLSFYNIGVKDVPMRPKVASDASTSIQERKVKVATDAPIQSRPHRTLGIDNTRSPFALPNAREDNADFYARMLARRSTANPVPPLASPTSPAKTLPEPLVRSNSTASQQHRYHSQRRRSQRHSQRHRPRPPTPKETIKETELQQVSSTDQQVSQLEQQVPATEKCIELPNVDCLRIPLPRRVSSLSGHFFFRRRPKSAPSYEIRTSGGEWTATNHTRSTPPYASAMVTEKTPAVRKSTTAATLPYTDSNAASADRALPPTHISSSSVPSGEQSAQMRQRHLAPTLGAQPAQSPVEDDDKAGCGFACNSCWPTTNNMQHQQRASNGDISSHSHYRQSRLAGGGTTGLLPSLASSWAHIYRSRPQAQSNSEGQHVGWRERRRIRRQNRSVIVRDVLAYPFQLGYNCLLWWLGPCVGLARECR
ncbi:hypothetical protein H4S03_000394 [Coemansia sp. S3946]|nr:hypothetical protein H4S03_000394 [Coemansia sp. S3946]